MRTPRAPSNQKIGPGRMSSTDTRTVSCPGASKVVTEIAGRKKKQVACVRVWFLRNNQTDPQLKTKRDSGSCQTPIMNSLRSTVRLGGTSAIFPTR